MFLSKCNQWGGREGGGALYHPFVNFKMYFAVMFRKHSIVTNKKIPSSDCWLQFSLCGHIFFLYPQEHSVLMCLSKQLIKHMTFKSQQCMVFFIWIWFDGLVTYSTRQWSTVSTSEGVKASTFVEITRIFLSLLSNIFNINLFVCFLPHWWWFS